MSSWDTDVGRGWLALVPLKITQLSILGRPIIETFSGLGRELSDHVAADA
jgi:hypothetical protein